ncbi:energy-coupling factor transporter transmembrane component T family protein [Tepidimicrobium xylanilyticum]|uniref:Energy-coupling factor transport system permease protein n=1 Tax=Tepidimicrobium xylanilyticum TaxID=1123352 RepID=A0A1H2R9L3_9FIRM|nr:energy-coupling factor transporter transmembrane component T [Tepidimicrobium xylanilyticum]NLW39561.1 energy-coupling factor transporter transmembrane protein EcfT [Tissierellia bacterium]GMG95492.1 cobalt ABC transporter permease [Tepidimicrobium xylanilyticum]SDW15544.1 energy-coupling factor transport system permease protein [Tepidimicrobium xylanilyticum]
MDMFLYIDKDTFLHRLDPRTKLAVMFGSFVIALLFESLPILLALAVIILLYGHSGKVLSNLKRIRVILFMIGLMSIVIWSITRGGETKLLGPITLEGIIYGITVGIKFNVMIISGMIFLSSTTIEGISLGLVKLKVPYRGAFAFSTAIRLVPMIVATSYTITQAQRSRGLDLDSGSFIQRIKKYVPLIIPTFVSVIRSTNVFSMALESKGFGYDKERTYYMELSFRSVDYVILIITLLLILVSIYAKITFKL